MSQPGSKLRVRYALASAFVAIAVGCSSSDDGGGPSDGGVGDSGSSGVLPDGASVDSASGGDGASTDASSGDASNPSDGSTKDGTVSDGGTDATSTGDGGVIVDGSDFLDASGYDGGACNTLANGASTIYQVNVATARPAATGGVILDGLYYKTDDVQYTGAGGNSGQTGYFVQETLLVTNATTGTAFLTSTFLVNATTNTTERITMSPTTGGGATTLTFICPNYGPSPTFYNVRAGDAGQVLLDIYISNDRIETFARQ